METNNDAIVLSVKELFRDKYVIPLYQRNFAWDYDQILCFLRDMYECFTKNEDFYIGSLVVLPRGNGEYEVIDGQQRLTMLSLLSIVLNCDYHHNLKFDSRQEVERYFMEDGKSYRLDSATMHYNIAKEWIDTEQLNQDGEIGITVTDLKDRLSDFYNTQIRIVREIMPSDTDVALYFEIMNNRGEQLQEHEVVKARFLGIIKERNKDLTNICSQIWDACSQMDIRVQKSKSFNSDTRKKLFGEKYDSLLFNDDADSLNSILNGNVELIEQNIFEIANSETDLSLGTEVEKENRDSNEESIIDFPNFLMHVFKLYYSHYKKDKQLIEIPLNEKYLLEVFNGIQWDDQNPPEMFFVRLLRCRVVFDRYIIKTEVESEEENRKWTLRKPTKNDDSTVRFINTFGQKDNMDDDDNDDNQKSIIHALTCLQTAFRQRPYKNYLQSILSWFKEGDIFFTAENYLNKIHSLLLSEYNRTCGGLVDISENDYKPGMLGTSTPHFFFNFLDYLYWKLSLDEQRIPNGLEDEISMIKGDFRFLYRNSIEHHYPQKRQEEMPTEGVSNYLLNCLGNLIFISKSVNSRLSDKNPIDKVKLSSSKDLPPNRQIIYAITSSHKEWGKKQIEQHNENIKTVLKHSSDILRVRSDEEIKC